MHDLVRQIDRVRVRARGLLLAQQASRVALWNVGFALAAIVADYLLRLPAGLRLAILLGGVGAIAVATVRAVGPALRFRPSLAQTALQCERTAPALAGRLAAAVDFVESGLEHRNALAAGVVRDTARRLEGRSLAGHVRAGPSLREVSAALAAVALVAVIAVALPDFAATGVRRLLLPFGDAAWPARTAVASLMDDVVGGRDVWPRGRVLPLRARNETPGGADERVEVRFRMRRAGDWEPWRTLVLTHQGDGVHERLVDTDAEGIEFAFATEDAQTAPRRLGLVPPPTVSEARLHVTPPDYAQAFVATRTFDLGTGGDARARTPEPVLAGSTVELEVVFNKPLPIPDAEADRAAWRRERVRFAATDGAAAAPVEPQLDASAGDRAASWRLRWTLDAAQRVRLDLVDADGLRNPDPIEYQVDAAPDAPPAVTMIAPERDRTVLATAVVPLRAEARDDVVVRDLELRAVVRRPGVAADEAGEVVASRTADADRADVAAELDLAGRGVAPGDVIEVFGAARDGLTARDDAEPARSQPRRIVVVSEVDFVTELRRALASVRQNAIRIEAQEEDLQAQLEEADAAAGREAAASIARQQAQVVDRIAQQRDAVASLVDDAERNRLDDAQVESLLRQSADLLDFAGRAASRATEAAERLAGARAPEAADADGLRQGLQEARDELADLIALLDRDEDSWLVERQIEAMLQQQQALADETSELARRTMGMSPEELGEAERQALAQVAEDQRGLRDEARRVVDELRRRAEALQEADPSSAESLREAAETAERREVDRDMDRAANEAEQNRLQAAESMQQSAIDTLERMLDRMTAESRNRAEELARTLESLAESIRQLAAVQEREIGALALAADDDARAALDRGMIRLAQNTRAVADEARAADRETRRIARKLDQAHDAQGFAVASLREAPPAAERAMESEERSLALLDEAREMAEQMEQQARDEEAQQRREAIVQAYRALAERQAVLRQETLPIAEAEELSRRQLVESRRLGSAQEEVRTQLLDLRERTEELSGSEVFSYVHELMDRWAVGVRDALWEGGASPLDAERQRRIAEAIARQIEAIEEGQAPPEDFARDGDGGGEEGGGQGGGGGGQGGGALPPVTELKRLQGLQAELLEETRRLDRQSDLDAAVREPLVRELGQIQEAVLRLAESFRQRMSQQGAPAPVPAPTPAPEGGDR